jgi:hypothetical protein
MSNCSSVQNSYSQVQNTPAAKAPVQSQKPAATTQPQQDTVTLSDAARKAVSTTTAGDVDHDGDNQ